MFSRSDSPTLPLTLSTSLIKAVSEPKSTIHLVAVFSPTPGIDGKLSLGSPRRAAKSGYCSGVKPYFVSTASGVIRDKSLTPRLGYKTVVFSLTNWKESRSPVQISTCNFSFPAFTLSVAMMSSASKPSWANWRIPNALTNSLRKDICERNSSGVLARLALYSGNISVRKVLRETSNATAMWVGFSSFKSEINMVAKP